MTREVPDAPRKPSPDLRPLVVRTSGSASEAVYGLILALSVIAVTQRSGAPDAGLVAVDVLVTAIVFWVAHAYAQVLGSDVSRERRSTRAEIAQALREDWSLVEVVIPLVAALALGAAEVIPDHAAIVAASVIALAELASAAGYAAIKTGASAGGAIVSAAAALVLGLVIVLLKVVVH